VGRAYGLSPREVQVLGQLVGGRSAEGIAEVLGVSPNTVRAHTRRIHEKLGVSSRDEIVALVECRRAAGARL
jgi:DNA-binding CsgD family transcriptional regulator